MARTTAALALASALAACAAAAGARSSELHCIGQTAHEVAYTLGQSPADTEILVTPAPARNTECLVGGIGHDSHICVGVNQDGTCAAARQSVLPLPGGAKCQGCFAGAATDVFYALNVSRLRVEHVGVGFRGTQLHSRLRVQDDQGHAEPARRGSVSWFERPFEWKVRVAGKVLLHLRISMPTTASYEFEARDGEHADAGAMLDVDLGEHSVQYTHGEGWKHRSDGAKVALQPIVEGDYNAQARLTVGVSSSLRVEVVDMAWFHVNATSEVPMSLTSIGASGADLIHTCARAGLRFNTSHEADLHISLFNKTLAEHWGPVADGHYSNASRIDKCVDVRPKKPVVVV